MRNFLLLFFIVFSSLLVAQNNSILVLHSYSQEYPWTKGQHDGFTKELKNSNSNVEIYVESLDTKHLDFTKSYREFFFNYLNSKYFTIKPDIIYVTDDNALTFIDEYKNSLFPDSVVVFSGINNLDIHKSLDKKFYTGVFEKKEPAENISIIKYFAPSAKDIYFLGDDSNTYKAIEKDLIDTMKKFPEYKAHFISDRYLSNVEKQLDSLNKSIVLLTTIGKFKDNNNKTLSIKSSLDKLDKKHKHIYMTMEDAYMHEKVIGGYVTSSSEQGKVAGSLVIKYLEGNAVEKIGYIFNSPNKYYFNREDLAHHNIKLPDFIEKEAFIINETVSFWDKYSKLLKLIFVLLVISSLILLLGLISIYKKKNQLAELRSEDLEKNQEVLQVQKEQLEELSNEQKNLLSLFDKGDAVLFKWKNNETWDVEYVSSNVSNLLGYNVDSFVNQKLAYGSLINTYDISRVVEEVTNAVEKNLDAFKHEPYRLETKSDGEKWILDYTVTQKNEDGEITHFLGYLIDITSQKKFEKELVSAKEKAEEATKAKSEFLANMSHEIRTPMTGILGFIDHLAKDEKDSERLKKFKVIKNSSTTLLTIINDILDFSKIESGKMDIDYHCINVKELFENIYEVFSELARDKSINFEKIVADDFPECMMVDEVRLKQVVSNLLHNAIKFTSNNGEIILKYSYDESSGIFSCSVSDTGIGISETNLKNIFDAFGQEDGSTTRRFGGTGLGLTISSYLIKMMGSELKVKSTLGIGSRFYFDIPLSLCSNCDTHLEVTNKLPNSMFKGSVLIVEDNKTNQLLISMILDDLGLNYEIANDGVEAIDKYIKNKYDIILMDENMPNLNGIEATKRIRAYEIDNKSNYIPIVAVTANALSEDRERFIEAGMDDYISKPYTQDDVVEIFKKYLID